MLRRMLCSAIIICSPSVGFAVDYLRDVKPILKERCFACHGALKQESGLRLDTAQFIRQGGDSGLVVQPGQDAGVLVERISAKTDDDRMPPEGKPLSKAEVDAIRNWIVGGASGPADEKPEEDPNQHWAFLPPLQADVPRVADPAWQANPIDAFIAHGHQQHGLRPVAAAEKRMLLRRVYLDLIGLPPIRSEIDAFLRDDQPNAYERVVDRLLDSPHHGERWGRHWMDIWRYTDWYGLGKQLRYSQKHIWHWRDWIVESLNEDRGYNRMIVEMLAADEVAPNDLETLRATGFLARNYFLFNRTTWLDNTIEHTSKALLGLTMNCTKCHDHKYDPISQVDYYRMRAFFEPHQVRLDTLPGTTDLERDGLPRVFDAHPDAVTYVHVRGNDKDPDKSRPIPPGVPRLLEFEPLTIEPVNLPAAAHDPALRAHVLSDHLRAARDDVDAATKALAQAESQLAKLSPSDVPPKPNAETPLEPTSAQAVIADEFDSEDKDQWQVGSGEWKYADGKLKVKVEATRAWVRSTKEHPTNFQATLKFRTTGGKTYRSVGFSFDVAGDREKLVYMSAVSNGSKVQVSYKTGGPHLYPPQGKQDRPVAINTDYELMIAVRDQLVNVSVDGQFALAYELPVAREAGRIDLVAYDAEAELDSFELRTLPTDIKLVKAGTAAEKPAGVKMTVESATAAVAVARRKLRAAGLRPAVLETAHAADVAKHQDRPADELSSLVLQAASAARAWELAVAEENVARAERKRIDAGSKSPEKQAADKELAAAQAAREKAEQALKKPGTAYPSLTASLKALEGPAESDASRRQPYPKTSTGRRTAFARWIADRRNPLTARVAVNHIWARHFGQPLVESVTDFGRRADRPVQHDLLDWLAVDFMENGWRMKHLHRQMVLSRTYRLRSSSLGADPQTREADPENARYWRRRPVRMESQVIRDSLLQLAGVLNPQVGGPSIKPQSANTTYRRSLYFTHSRDDQHKFLNMFDDADILRCYRRQESIVPQQALTLANSRLALTMSRKIAARIDGYVGDSPDDADAAFVRAAFSEVLATEPTEAERDACFESLQQVRKLLESRGPEQASRRAKENLVHALLNHNDFVTVR